MIQAGLQFTYTPESNRVQQYTGPAIEDLPLSADEKTLLLNHLTK